MPLRPSRCKGGCGKTQPLTVEPKGMAGKATFTPPWTCPQCKAKEEKKRQADAAKKDMGTATPKKPAEKGFTFISPRERAILRGQGGAAITPPAPPAAPASKSPAPPPISGGSETHPAGDPQPTGEQGLEALAATEGQEASAENEAQ